MSVLNQLNMTPFEWTMTEEIAAGPQEFVLQLNCSGDVDVQQFSQAVLEEVKHQPLLQANAEIGPTHRLSHWRPGNNLVPEIHWLEEEYSSESGFPNNFAPINLENEIGFRFYGWRFKLDDTPQVVMKFVLHHCCCDGKGGIEFVERVLLRYQCLLGPEIADDQSACDSQNVLNRNLPPPNRLSVRERFWRSVVVRPQRVANMFLAKPCELVTRSVPSNELFDVPPRQCSTTLDVKTTAALGQLAKSRNATTNLVLAKELFVTLNHHLKQSVAPDSKASLRKRCLRILIPFSLRDKRHQAMPSMNCVSMAYLEAREDYLGNDSDLLPELVRQFNFIKRWQIQYSWIESTQSYAKIWPLLKHFAKWKSEEDRRKKPIATSVMSNLGRFFSNPQLTSKDGKVKIGTLEIETVHLALPCSPTLSTNFSLNFYRGRLTLDVTYLPSLVSRETAQSLLDSWTQRVCDSVQADRESQLGQR